MSATQPEEPISRRGRDRSEATRSALIDLAVELFSTRGYAETSMRDIAREGPVSMGAIYLHFKNKAELLVEALETKIAEDLEGVNPPGPVDHVERLTSAGRDIAARRELRALLVQAAAAAQTDDEARTRIREAQEAHVNDWIERYEADRERLELDRDLDLPTAVLYTWAAELGLGMLEAFGMGSLDPDDWADFQNRVGRSFRLPKASG